MLGSFITRGLVLIFGYVYPAYECYKTVEKNKPSIEDLIFWCRYWMLMASVIVGEIVFDTFLSWVPMYSEAKLAFIIYLWHHKTRGTTYVYDAFFKPFIAKHETDIDRNLLEMKTRAGDLVFTYWQNAASYGQTRVFDILQYVASQSTRKPAQKEAQQQQAPRARQPAAAPTRPSSNKIQPVAEDLPSPTSSTSSTQHQKEVEQEASSSDAQVKTVAALLEAPPLNIQKRAVSLKPATEASTAKVALRKVLSNPTPASSSSQSVTSEAEPKQKQIEAAPSTTDKEKPPTSDETVMEETIRVTRGRLRKTRSNTAAAAAGGASTSTKQE